MVARYQIRPGNVNAVSAAAFALKASCSGFEVTDLLVCWAAKWLKMRLGKRPTPTRPQPKRQIAGKDAHVSMNHPSHAPSRSRILFLDENIRDIGGHYLELASLLAAGASELGYQPQLVTNQALRLDSLNAAHDDRLKDVAVLPEFTVRRMETWSLGVDGAARAARDSQGRFLSGTRRQRIRQRITERWTRRKRNPHQMLSAWTKTFRESVVRFRPTLGDRIVVNTGSDFHLLALVEALRQLGEHADGENTHSEPLHVHVIFHFAVYETPAQQLTDRAVAFGIQVNQALASLSRHQVRLHATTEPLAEQMTRVGIPVTAIPYPTRTRPLILPTDRDSQPIKILLAGIPRAEKGRGQIKQLLQTLEHSHLRSGRIRWSMQVPEKRWQRYLPPSATDLSVTINEESGVDSNRFPLQLLRGNLSSNAYHAWLDGADIGLFLYDANRYVARCSGVLLEMMTRGIPVIVPDHCWLADQVRLAKTDHPVGWIYQSTSEIPALIDRATRQLDRVREACIQNAAQVAETHRGRNTLLEMGIPDQLSLGLRRAS